MKRLFIIFALLASSVLFGQEKYDAPRIRATGSSADTIAVTASDSIWTGVYDRSFYESLQLHIERTSGTTSALTAEFWTSCLSDQGFVKVQTVITASDSGWTAPTAISAAVSRFGKFLLIGGGSSGDMTVQGFYTKWTNQNEGSRGMR